VPLSEGLLRRPTVNYGGLGGGWIVNILGTVTLNSSEVTGNTAANGGGIFNFNGSGEPVGHVGYRQHPGQLRATRKLPRLYGLRLPATGALVTGAYWRLMELLRRCLCRATFSRRSYG
jgi:hypothetical protein